MMKKRSKILPKDASVSDVYDKAIELLSRRMHSAIELTRKLKQRSFSASVIAEVITMLEEKRYLNDDNFAETYLNNLVRYKTLGFYGIKSKLMQKGISSELANAALAEHFDIKTEISLAKKYLSKINPDNKKSAAALARRGFRIDVIRKVLDQNDI